MPKYQYKRYISRAFWNTLFAFLSALVLVLIILYGWEAVRSVMNSLSGAGEEETATPEDVSRLEQLESLKGTSDISEEEKGLLLQSLSSDAADMSQEEKLELLNSLKGNETDE